MPSRTFGTPIPEVVDVDPIEFDLAGGHFRCVDVPPPEAVDRAADLLIRDPDDQTEIALALGVIIDFLLEVVTEPEQLIIAIQSGAIDDVVLTDVFMWVCTEYVAKIKGATTTQITATRPATAAELLANPPADPGDWPTSHLPTSTADEVFDLSPSLIHFTED